MTIFVTFFIYIRTGRQIYLRYKTLRSLNSQSREPEPLLITEPFSTKTTEVFVTSEIVSTSLHTDAQEHCASTAAGVPQAAYTVEITSDANAPRRKNPAHAQPDASDDEKGRKRVKPAVSGIDTAFSPPSSPISSMAPQSPTSVTAPITGRTVMKASDTVRRNRRNLAVYEANNAAWSYTKCALLFFTALLITWIPSTANRLYSVVHQKQILLGLEYASAFVLPLQGFWNGLIYVFTTRRSCKKLIGDILYYLPNKLLARPKEINRTVRAEDKHSSWSGPGRQMGIDRNSFMLGFVPSNGKAGKGFPIEAYERM